jgi:AcrR family transcriptional regulator
MYLTMSQDVAMTSSGRAYGGMSAAERAESRRLRLIEAGRRVIAQNGVAAVTVEQVSQEAGLTKRYFYSTFGSREALLDACAEQLFGLLGAAMAAALAAPSPAERMHATVRGVVRILASDAAWARLYVECPAFTHLRERQEQAIKEFTDRIASEAMPFTGDSPDPVDRYLATRILVAGSTDLIISWLRGAVPADEESVIATIVATAEGAATTM